MLMEQAAFVRSLQRKVHNLNFSELSLSSSPDGDATSKEQAGYKRGATDHEGNDGDVLSQPITPGQRPPTAEYF